LESDPGFLQQVGLDVAAGQLPRDVEVDPDKLTLIKRVMRRFYLFSVQLSFIQSQGS
jgi:hypothetical protein